MQVLKLKWVPTGQVFAQAKTFEEAVGTAAARVLRAGHRSFTVLMGDDGESFEMSTPTAMLVSASPGTKVHHLAKHTDGEPAGKKSFLQSTAGKPPANGWYKGSGRRYNLAADPRKGPYFLVLVDADDNLLRTLDIRQAYNAAKESGAELPLEVALMHADVAEALALGSTTDVPATFALVLRDDNPPKLKVTQKWMPSEGPRSMQVVFRRPL